MTSLEDYLIALLKVAKEEVSVPFVPRTNEAREATG